MASITKKILLVTPISCLNFFGLKDNTAWTRLECIFTNCYEGRKKPTADNSKNDNIRQYQFCKIGKNRKQIVNLVRENV
jgi:hypothetical protein